MLRAYCSRVKGAFCSACACVGVLKTLSASRELPVADSSVAGGGGLPSGEDESG